jgi:hypothetical protein
VSSNGESAMFEEQMLNYVVTNDCYYEFKIEQLVLEICELEVNNRRS